MNMWGDEDEVLCARCKVATMGADMDYTETARLQFLLDRAVTAAKALPNRSRDLDEFFYQVHGVAL